MLGDTETAGVVMKSYGQLVVEQQNPDCDWSMRCNVTQVELSFDLYTGT